jgi:hypothetical protein
MSVAALKRRLRACEYALSFYADPETYFAIGVFPDRPCGEFINDFTYCDTMWSPKVWKPGKRARAYFRKFYAKWAKQNAADTTIPTTDDTATDLR